jgi:hypothetical protein
MTDNFVGFAQSPKPDPNKTVTERELELTSNLELAGLLAPFITKAGLEGWLGEFSKFDFQTGAKLKYKSNDLEYGASYSMITLPKRIVLVTESLGEIDVKISHGKKGSVLRIKFRLALLPNQVKSFNAEIDEIALRLRSTLGG